MPEVALELRLSWPILGDQGRPQWELPSFTENEIKTQRDNDLVQGHGQLALSSPGSGTGLMPVQQPREACPGLSTGQGSSSRQDPPRAPAIGHAPKCAVTVKFSKESLRSRTPTVCSGHLPAI